MGRVCLVFLTYLFLSFVWVSPSTEAALIFTEIYADPAKGTLGDANGDGVRSQADDEFVEFLNIGSSSVDLSGWYLSDATKVRHIFFEGTMLLPYHFLVVFAGGSPSVPAVDWQLASSGGLSLNNAGDTVSLFNVQSTLEAQVVYGSNGAKDQSLTRFPENISSPWELHSQVDGSEGLIYSPGRRANGEIFLQESEDGVHVPEPSSYICFLMGLLYFFKKNSLFG